MTKQDLKLGSITNSITVQNVNVDELFKHLTPSPAPQRFKMQYRDPDTQEWIGTQIMEDVRLSDQKMTEEESEVVIGLTYLAHGSVRMRINRKREARLRQQAEKK